MRLKLQIYLLSTLPDANLRFDCYSMLLQTNEKGKEYIVKGFFDKLTLDEIVEQVDDPNSAR